MDLSDAPEQAEYRRTVRRWLDDNAGHAPPAKAFMDEDYVAARRQWQRRLAEGGLVAVTWPQAYGGAGLGPLDQVVVNQELARRAAPGPLDSVGIGMVGPTIIAFGNEEQKERHLGPLIRAEILACQLFSEPAAGSDLAAVELTATPLPSGGWRLNGQKVWSSGAHLATVGMLLARTDLDAAKHAGLSMFLVPMDTPGITVRGLRQVTGESEFNEVFFDDVVIDANAILGEPGDGWAIAGRTLLFERLALALNGESTGVNLVDFAGALREFGARSSSEILERAGEVAAEMLAVRFFSYQMLSAIGAGGTPGLEAGLAKLTSVAASRGAAQVVADLGGQAALDDPRWALLISWLPGLRAGGGSDEILRNAIGDRVLGLPREPRIDVGVSFRDLRQQERTKR